MPTPHAVSVSQKANALNALIDTIRRGIADRGFFLLMDDRIKLICGDDCNETTDLLPHFAVVSAFSERHKWRSQIHENTVTFWSAD